MLTGDGPFVLSPLADAWAVEITIYLIGLENFCRYKVTRVSWSGYTVKIKTATRRPPQGVCTGSVGLPQCRAAAALGSPVELRNNKWYRNQCDCGSNHIYLHLAEPRQCLQTGVTQEENRHQSNHQLVHAYLRYHLLFRWLYHRRPATRYP